MSDNGLYSRLIHGLSFEKTLGTGSWMTVAVANKFDCVQVYHWRTCHLRAHWIGRYGPTARMSTNQGPSTVLFWWTIENTGTSEQGLKLRTYPGLSCKIKKVSTFPGPGGQQLKIRTFPGNKDPWEPWIKIRWWYCCLIFYHWDPYSGKMAPLCWDDPL